MKKKDCIEALRLEVICPAKARARQEKSDIIELVSSNYRFLGTNEKSLSDWHGVFRRSGLNFEAELQKLVKLEFGKNFEIRKREYSGYLGVTSDTWFEAARRDEKKGIPRVIQNLLMGIARKIGKKRGKLQKEISKGGLFPF